MKVRIEIDTKTFVRFWLVVVGFAFVILALYMARTALVILGTAAFLALALNAPVNYLSKRIPGKSRTGATALAFVIVVAIVSGFIFLVVPPIVQQTVRFVESAPQIVDNVAQQWKGIGQLIDEYHIQPQVDAAVQSLRDSSGAWLTNTSKNILGSVGSVFGLIATTFLTLVLSFLMLIEGPTWMKRLWRVYDDPEKMEAHRNLAIRMHDVVTGYVTGQLTVSGIGALCSGAGIFLISLFIHEVPGNLALPAVAISFLFSLIPMFGSTIAGVLISILLLFNSFTAAIIFAIYFIVYQQIENNFISPTIQSRYIKLSPLAVLVAVTVGLYLFGLAGGIISIPIAGCVKVLAEEYFNRRKTEQSKKKPLGKLIKKLQGGETS